MKIIKTDYIGMGIAILGNVFLTAWCMWSYDKYNIVGVDMTGFIASIFGV